ncbi:hypothetical protein [Micrococcus luteus]|uniref:hypothetical protein n=1 Tax=Micrococcus luteus TaxID=1270 RepID=UPI0023034702|nr:hypothetical protein [Micrococcus luteus]
MALTADTRILLSTDPDTEPVTGTVGGLIRHHRRVNPCTLITLEQSLGHQGRLPNQPADQRESILLHNLDTLTLADLNRLEPNTTITLAQD